MWTTSPAPPPTLARECLKYHFDAKQQNDFITQSRGYNQPLLKRYAANHVWESNPKFHFALRIGDIVHTIGYPGQPTSFSQTVFDLYVFPDMLPWVVPTALATLAWWWMFDNTYSVFNWTVMKLGLVADPVPWLADPYRAMASVTTVNVWRGLPFFAVTILPGSCRFRRRSTTPREPMAPDAGSGSCTSRLPMRRMGKALRLRVTVVRGRCGSRRPARCRPC